MEALRMRFEAYKQRLEEDSDYEMSVEMQEEYFELKEDIEMSFDLDLRERFERLSQKFENPESVSDATLGDMYPDTDGEFDLDEWD